MTQLTVQRLFEPGRSLDDDTALHGHQENHGQRVTAGVCLCVRPVLLFSRTRCVIRALLGEKYFLMPGDIWTWHLDNQSFKSGWGPHRRDAPISVAAYLRTVPIDDLDKSIRTSYSSDRAVMLGEHISIPFKARLGCIAAAFCQYRNMIAIEYPNIASELSNFARKDRNLISLVENRQA